MKNRTLILAAALTLASVAPAFADAAPAATTWGDALAPFAPIVVPVIAGLVIALGTWATASLQRMTGLQLFKINQETLHSAAETAAGQIWAAATQGIAKDQIKVGDPRIQKGIDWVIQHGAPDAVKALNVTSDQIESLIVAKLGQMQANSPPAAPAS